MVTSKHVYWSDGHKTHPKTFSPHHSVYVVALTGKANHLAQRNSPHNKRMKRGPLVRLLQNLPELHPTLSSSQLFMPRCWCSSPSAVTAAALTYWYDSRNIFLLSGSLHSQQKTRYHESAAKCDFICIALCLRCSIIRHIMSWLVWKQKADPQNTSPHVKNVACLCRCSFSTR